MRIADDALESQVALPLVNRVHTSHARSCWTIATAAMRSRACNRRRLAQTPRGTLRRLTWRSDTPRERGRCTNYGDDDVVLAQMTFTTCHPGQKKKGGALDGRARHTQISDSS